MPSKWEPLYIAAAIATLVMTGIAAIRLLVKILSNPSSIPTKWPKGWGQFAYVFALIGLMSLFYGVAGVILGLSVKFSYLPVPRWLVSLMHVGFGLIMLMIAWFWAHDFD